MRIGAWVCALVVGMLGLGAAGESRAYDYEYDEVFTCESHDRRQEYCEVDARGGVVLVNQLSRTSCVEGRTWGWDGRGVWVSGGCRAEFALVRGRGRGRGYDRDYDRDYDNGPPDSYPAGGGYVIRCESRDHGYHQCAVRVRGGVELQRQLSDAYCEERATWGYDRRGIWVDGGCRGEFVIYE